MTPKMKQTLAHAAKTANGATDADVVALMAVAQRYASAGVMNMTPRDQSGDTTLYGEYRVTNNNTFEKYAQLSIITPHVFIPLIKLGLSTVSGLKLELPPEPMGTGSDDLLIKMTEWAQYIGLANKVQNIARCMMRDGTTVVSIGREPIDTTIMNRDIINPTNGITALSVLPMQYMTLLTEAESTGVKKGVLIKGDPTIAILNEAKKTADAGLVRFERAEFALFRLFNEGYFMNDILGRETYGIYGASLIEPITRPIKGLLDLTEGFGAYMRRYGINRLNINLPIVEDLRREGRYEEAKTILQDTIGAMKKLGAHEDMVSGGADVTAISSGAVPSVRDMKESYEADIQVGLLQSPLTMGKASGTTYASGFLSEADRMVIVESIQAIILDVVQAEIINPQLIAYGATNGAVIVTAVDLTVPVIDPQVMTDARLNNDITMGEYRASLGLSATKPEEAKGNEAADNDAIDDEEE